MKYIVYVDTLEWHTRRYIVDAESEDEIDEEYVSEFGTLEDDDIDCTDQFDIVNVVKYED